MTAKELYDRDDTFRHLIASWVEKQEIPYPLQDRLLDFGLESQADCVRWCWEQKEFRVYPVGYSNYRDGRETKWYWCDSETSPRYRTHYVPYENCGIVHYSSGGPDHPHRHKSPTDAILWLLDNWKVSEVKV